MLFCTVEDVATARAISALTSPVGIGLKGTDRLILKKFPLSSPYPQLRVARSPSLSGLASTNACVSNITSTASAKGTTPSSRPFSAGSAVSTKYQYTLAISGDQSGTCLYFIFVVCPAYHIHRAANTERHLDLAKSHGQRAEDKTDELKQLNRSIFRPVITFNKDAKRRAQEAKILDRYEEERLERERTMMDVRETQNRLGRAATYGRGTMMRTCCTMALLEQRTRNREMNSRYRSEATASDDELEDELDENLDEILDVTKRLKALGTAMSQD
ncbi:hypothetical protein GGU11DRAFT_847426 [Lentinula aff. detonsa]|nr:hypothetical protein GGU11DRAFT_847426 [Lentinula aff. detonsa]